MFFVYVPPENSTVYEHANQNGIEHLNDKFSEVTTEYTGAYSVLAGDFDSRTKDLQDFVTHDNIDHIFSGYLSNYPTDKFNVPRRWKDNAIHNEFEKSLIKLCRANNVHILNGRINGDGGGGQFYMFSNEEL